jgi:protein-L-isoaspartate O-methyltransferase
MNLFDGNRLAQTMLNLSSTRERMVEAQIKRRGVRDRNVLEAMRIVPREAFVEPVFEELEQIDEFFQK